MGGVMRRPAATIYCGDPRDIYFEWCNMLVGGAWVIGVYVGGIPW